MSPIGCNCGGKKSGASAPKLSWRVDLNGTEFSFSDNTKVKTFATQGEANLAIRTAGAMGKVRARPSVG